MIFGRANGIGFFANRAVDFLPHAGQRDGDPLGHSASARRPRHGPLGPRGVRLLYHLVGHCDGQSCEQKSGRTVAGRTGGAAVCRASREVDPPLHHTAHHGCLFHAADRRDVRLAAHDPSSPDDDIRLGVEDQGQESVGQGRHGGCPGGGCGGRNQALSRERPRVLPQP